MNKCILLFVMSLICSGAFASGENCIYQVKYSKAYLLQHRFQLMKALTATLWEGDSPDISLSLTGISAKTGHQYDFYDASDKVSDDVACASLEADGDQPNGCVQFKKTDEGLVIKPVAMRYSSSNENMATDGIHLTHCAGRSTDGEGCVRGSLRTIILSPNNSETNQFVLKKIRCIATP